MRSGSFEHIDFLQYKYTRGITPVLLGEISCSDGEHDRKMGAGWKMSAPDLLRELKLDRTAMRPLSTVHKFRRLTPLAAPIGIPEQHAD